MTEHWIWLAGRPGLGPINCRRLLEQFGSAEAVFEADAEALTRAGVTPAAGKVLADKDLTAARAVLEACRTTGIRTLTLKDPAYPARLRQIVDAPVVLYCGGSLPEQDSRPCIGLVGSRKADEAGLAAARRLGWQIAGCGGVVVTGMAKGVDAMAARGALEQSAPVIGVLGCGIDVVYPRENAALLRQVREQGCLLSEYPPGTKPNARHFPARNRIISALSDGVVVVQATADSGALITARWAADQGRDVFAVPGPAEAPLSRGCNQLLREGAILTESGWDVLREYEYRYPTAVREYHGRPPAAELSPALKPEPQGRSVPQSKPVPAPRQEARRAPDLSGFSPDQQTILRALEAGPMQLDELIHRTGLPAARILPQLTLLQMKKTIACQPGKRYSILKP